MRMTRKVQRVEGRIRMLTFGVTKNVTCQAE
jgi:hypothetical protein